MYWPFYHYEKSVLVSGKPLIFIASCVVFNIAISALSWLPFAWLISSHSFSFNLFASSILRCVSRTQRITEFYFFKSSLIISAFCLACLDIYWIVIIGVVGLNLQFFYLFYTSTVFFVPLLELSSVSILFIVLFQFLNFLSLYIFLVVAVRITICILVYHNWLQINSNLMKVKCRYFAPL